METEHQHADANLSSQPPNARPGLRFDLRALFLIVGFVALATAALTWRDRALPSALFVAAASACGIIATILRSRPITNVVIAVILLWLAVVIGTMVVIAVAV